MLYGYTTRVRPDVDLHLRQQGLAQCASGNSEKAERLATSAAETEGVANRHAMQALDAYRHRAEEVASRKAEADAEQAARTAKHEKAAAANK